MSVGVELPPTVDVLRQGPEGDADRELYLALMREQGERLGVRFLAWRLMSSHASPVGVPEGERSRARRHLIQGRCGSSAPDEERLLAAARCVELNPVAAGVVDTPAAYAWSSARFHLDGRVKRDPLVVEEDRDLLGLVDDWRAFLAGGADQLAARRLERRPGCGADGFAKRLEKETRRVLSPREIGWRTGRAET